jgi:hypothetical protein
MSVRITIGSNVINFPTSGTDPNWAQAVTDFAIYASQVINGITTPFDVISQETLLPQSGTVNLNANFDRNSIRSFVLTYAIYRKSTTDGVLGPGVNIVEAGQINGIFSDSGWVYQRDFTGNKKSDGTSYHSFTNNVDTVQVTTSALPSGLYDTAVSKIVYYAKAEPINVT